MNIWLNFLIDSVAFGATFIYGSTGEILTEKAGHLNLGIPGVMCMGGAGGCLILNMIGKSGLPPFMIVLVDVHAIGGQQLLPVLASLGSWHSSFLLLILLIIINFRPLSTNPQVQKDGIQIACTK
jgi:ABC-type uncharacterized transport system permease subunit